MRTRWRSGGDVHEWGEGASASCGAPGGSLAENPALFTCADCIKLRRERVRAATQRNDRQLELFGGSR